MGYPDRGPYDAIHVGAAAKEMPRPVNRTLQDFLHKFFLTQGSRQSYRDSTVRLLQLIDQLAPGGRLIVPMGPENADQILMQIDKTPDGKIKQRSLISVVFVPLTDKDRQYRRS